MKIRIISSVTEPDPYKKRSVSDPFHFDVGIEDPDPIPDPT